MSSNRSTAAPQLRLADQPTDPLKIEKRRLLEFDLEVFHVQRLGNGLVGNLSITGV